MDVNLCMMTAGVVAHPIANICQRCAWGSGAASTRNNPQPEANQTARCKEISSEAIDSNGGPTRIRTWNQQIMSPISRIDKKEDQQFTSAKSSKKEQKPLPRRNQKAKVIPFPKDTA
jgi:hypothetical protein